MRFGKGQMPPVKGFWSLTMYDPEFIFVPNPINRYSLSQRDTFVTNADGSVDLYLQAESPGPDREANWHARTEGQVHPRAAALLAPGCAALDPGWVVDAAPGATRTMTGFWLLPWLPPARNIWAHQHAKQGADT